MKNIFLSIAISSCSFSATAQSYDSLDINHIHAGFNAGGDLFYNVNSGSGHISAPGNQILYSIGNLWIGGFDAGNNLHLAAQTYRQSGTDFWPGPLDTTSATCDMATSFQYNKVWKLNCAEVDSFYAYTQGTGPSGYSVSTDIQTWPGNNNTALGFSRSLAPYVDVDGDGFYNWTVGDLPSTRGTQSLFYVYNDALVNHIHTQSYAQPIGVEVQAMPYAFDYPWSDALLNTIFIHYIIINRSPVALNATKIGFWSNLNFASGISKMGSDSMLGAYYTYDSTNAAGVIFLNNQMAGCIGYNNSFSSTGNPNSGQNHYDYMSQHWLNGSPLTVGGNGYGGTTQTNWMYSGDPTNGSGWNDNASSDKRIVGSTANFVLQPGVAYTFDVAMVFANDSAATFSSVAMLKQYMQQVKSFYQTESQICLPWLTSVGENTVEHTISISPNPASEQITIHTSNTQPQPYSIFDVTGQVVQSGIISGNGVLEISEFPAGMYFVRVGKDEGATTLKFVKTNE